MRKTTKRIISTVAALAVVIGGFGAYRIFAKEDVASVVLLDINPSIELQVDDDAEVIRAVPLNEDAKVVLRDMHLEDTNVTTAVNAIVGSLFKHGYIDELANSILLSVEDGNTARGAKLKEELTKEINDILSATKINASLLVQSVENANAGQLADELNISKGKASLIQNIVEVNNAYEEKDLAKLSVNELNLVLSNPKNDAVDVATTGKANEKAYIGAEKAKEVAFADAQVNANDVRKAEVEFDYDYGKLVYEVDFASGEYEYDYSIEAVNGNIVHSHREFDDDYVKPADKEVHKHESEHHTDIGKEHAKKIALGHAGLSESEVTRLHVECDDDDGRLKYEVEFVCGNKEYNYEINGTSGYIHDCEVEIDD